MADAGTRTVTGRFEKRLFQVRLLTGCSANNKSIFRQQSLSNSTVLVTTDAKQRAIIQGTRMGENGHEEIVCVEPSPDALSVIAASFDGDLTIADEGSLGARFASSESAANIGLRTQSITLLRDQGYRVCEAYLNRAIGGLDYAQLLRRNQVITTAILAIEQLTGTVTGPNVTVGASSSLDVDRELLALRVKGLVEARDTVETKTKELDDANTNVSTLETSVTAKETSYNAAKAIVDGGDTSQAAKDKLEAAKKAWEEEQTKLETAKTAKTNAEKALADAQSALEVAEENLRIASAPNLRATTTGTSNPSAVREEQITAIAGTVERIVEFAFSKTYILDLCQMYWGGSLSIENTSRPKIDSVCDTVLVELRSALGSTRDYVKAQTELQALVATGKIEVDKMRVKKDGAKSSQVNSRSLPLDTLVPFSAPTDIKIN